MSLHTFCPLKSFLILKRTLNDQLRLPLTRQRLRLLRRPGHRRGASITYRPGNLRPQLPPGDGVCGEVDVLDGQAFGHAVHDRLASQMKSADEKISWVG